MTPKDNNEQLRNTLTNIFEKIGDKDALKNFTNHFTGMLKEMKKSIQEEKARESQENDGGNKTIGSLYFHLFNGGMTFSVVDEGSGATIVVDSNSFGNMETEMRLHTNANGLKQLGEMFIMASKAEYSEGYAHIALPEGSSENVQGGSE